jgi:hypothetical protein
LSALSAREALRAFDALKPTPEFFRRYLQRYLSCAELGSRAALDDTLGRVLLFRVSRRVEYGHYQFQDDGFVEWLRQPEFQEQIPSLARRGRGGYGAGDGNRTHVSSLGSCSSTIELHPQPVLILQEFPRNG